MQFCDVATGMSRRSSSGNAAFNENEHALVCVCRFNGLFDVSGELPPAAVVLGINLGIPQRYVFKRQDVINDSGWSIHKLELLSTATD